MNENELDRLYGGNPLIKSTLDQPVTSQEAIAQQRRLDQSQGIENPYLGMSFSELKALGHGLR